MVWISVIFFMAIAMCEELPKFLTKHAVDSIRFISMDGNLAYVQKRPGVLGLVSSFRSIDFLSESSASDFIMSGSHAKNRLLIEVIPQTHTLFDLNKAHKILVVSWGNTQTTEVAQGRSPRLHLKDEWLSYFDTKKNSLQVLNLETKRKYEIPLSSRTTSFFIPHVEMLTSAQIIYTDINQEGHAALISYRLDTKKSTLIYKSPFKGTELELCQNRSYIAIGEFPFRGVEQGAKIMKIDIGQSVNLSGHTTIYQSHLPDIGHMVCLPNSIYFIKALSYNKQLTTVQSDVFELNIKSLNLTQKSKMGNITQIIEMDERILIPHREHFYVIEGTHNLSSDILRPSNPNEELPLEL